MAVSLVVSGVYYPDSISISDIFGVGTSCLARARRLGFQVGLPTRFTLRLGSSTEPFRFGGTGARVLATRVQSYRT